MELTIRDVTFHHNDMHFLVLKMAEFVLAFVKAFAIAGFICRPGANHVFGNTCPSQRQEKPK